MKEATDEIDTSIIDEDEPLTGPGAIAAADALMHELSHLQRRAQAAHPPGYERRQAALRAMRREDCHVA